MTGMFPFYEHPMKEQLIQIQESMKKAGASPSPIYQYVINHGIPFSKIRLTPEEVKILEASKQKFVFKEYTCFYNAMMMWLFDNRLKYCEGFCSAFEEKIIYPTYHSWNVLHDKLVDVTPPERYQYFGVIFPDEVTDKYIQRGLKEETITPIIDDYIHHHEFLREKGYIK